MLLPRTYAWSRTQKCILVAALLVASTCFVAVVYAYEHYCRGPSDSVLFGTWRCTSGCYYALYYQFTPEHNIRVLADDDPSTVIAQGRWYAGGDFIYLRFPEPVPGLKRAILVYRIVDVTPDQVRVRIWRDDEVRSYRRVTLDATNASNQAMQRTAGRCAFPLSMTSNIQPAATRALASGR